MDPARAGALFAAAVVLAALLVLTRPGATVGGASNEHLSDQKTCVSDCESEHQICCLEKSG